MGRPKRRSARRNALPIRTVLILIPVLIIIMMSLSVQVFAKNTYVITDGGRTFTYSTFATDPIRVLDEAGLELDENDTYTTHIDAGTSSITIRRSQSITIEQYGEAATVSSFGETVGELLTRLNITLEDSDVLSVSADTVTYDNMTFRIDRVLKVEQTYTSPIPYETTYCYDSSLPAGSETVLTAGVCGELLCTATVTYVNGTETARNVHKEVVSSAPVTEVVAIGTAGMEPADPKAMPVIGDGYIILPSGETLLYTGTMQVCATAYTHTDAGCDFITYTGTTVHIGTVAVDPRYIPYGTRMFIVANDGSYVYGISTAEDCGGAIKGDRVDLYFPTYNDCILFGVRDCTIYFLGTEE